MSAQSQEVWIFLGGPDGAWDADENWFLLTQAQADSLPKDLASARVAAKAFGDMAAQAPEVRIDDLHGTGLRG